MNENEREKRTSMPDKTIYLKMDAKIKLRGDVVRIGDLGKVYCEETNVVNKIKTLQIYRFQKSDKNRCVIGVLKVIELIHQEYPGFTIDIVGETESIVEQLSEKSKPRWIDYIKITFVSALCFFGTIYTVMSYHNEISIVDLFDEIYVMMTGMESDGFTALEAAYSIGLSLGIIIFYNHIGKRKLTPDPSPISVEMRTYEDDVNQALVELANREEKTIDVN